MEYHFFPPFFVFPEEASFEDAWEAFCCKLLMLLEARDDIIRRKPPERGVDLFCADTRTAYQCKSVESGRTGAFAPSKAIASIQAAQLIRDELGWDRYVLCTNVDLTGTAEAKLREAAPGIELRSRSYWLSACERFPDAVARNFRQIVQIPQDRATCAIRDSFGRRLAEEVRMLMENDPATLMLYSWQHDRVYVLPVSLDVKTGDLIRVLVNMFGLPKALSRTLRGLKIIISHGLMSGSTELPPERTLRANGVAPRSLLTFSTQTQATTPSGIVTTVNLNRELLPESGISLEDYEEVSEAIRVAFSSFDHGL